MKTISCTSDPCEWLPPSMKNVPYVPISDINFSVKHKMLFDDQPPRKSSVTRGKDIITSPSQEEFNIFQ